MSESLRFARSVWRLSPDATRYWSLVEDGGTGENDIPPQVLGSHVSFMAALHPLHQEFLAYRAGLADGQPHKLSETATRFGIDLNTARVTEAYLQARFRVYVDRMGWRGSTRRW